MLVLGPPWYTCWSRRTVSCAIAGAARNGTTRAAARMNLTVMVFLRRLIESAMGSLIDEFGAGCRPVTDAGNISLPAQQLWPELPAGKGAQGDGSAVPHRKEGHRVVRAMKRITGCTQET